MRSFLCVIAVAGCAACAQAQGTYNVRTDWSETANPNGVWTYAHGSTPLPHVDSWQRTLGGWSQPQPGWARSEDTNTRLPFWFRSNGSEQFARDYLAGDIVVHTTDDGSGAGSGPATLIFTSPTMSQI